MSDIRAALDTLKEEGLEIRQSDPNDGPIIYELFKNSHKTDVAGVDWTQDMGPYWLIATYYDKPVGCIMVRPGKPFGNLEDLCVNSDLPHRIHSQVVVKLLRQGLDVLKQCGCQAVGGMVDRTQDAYKLMLEHRGAVKWYEGEVYAFKL